MRRLTSIVAVNEQGAIGIGNSLPWRVRSDLRFFREQTEGQVVIMGRKTYDSLNGGLKNRRNIIVTHNFSMFPNSPDKKIVHGIPEALHVAEGLAGRSREVFVIGGASMYEQFLPFVDRYLVTEVKKKVPDADTFLPLPVTEEIEAWDRSVIKRGLADGSGDEADFTVWEFVHPNPSASRIRRAQAVAALDNRRAGNRLAAV